MKLKYALLVLLTGSLSSTAWTAQRMITILGPDGRPLLVPYSVEKKQDKRLDLHPKKQPVSVQQQTLSVQQPVVEQLVQPTVQKDTQAQTASQSPKKHSFLQNVKIGLFGQSADKAAKERVQVDGKVGAKTEQQAETKTETKEPPSTVTATPPRQMSETPTDATDQGIHRIDGEVYYDAEYLEANEFNLERKKRFYPLPSSAGGATWQVLEREKGVDMSWFNAQKQQEEAAKNQAIVFGDHYTVISKADLQQSLPEQCFTDKKRLNKAKILESGGELPLWPRAALKTDFSYELVKLDSAVHHFELMSFASAQANPQYYWPAAVFLDKSGCVIEGVSAFFQKDYPMTMLQRAAIKGTLHVPKQSQYVMLIALEHAVDLPDFQLSEKGQIKLVALD